MTTRSIRQIVTGVCVAMLAAGVVSAQRGGGAPARAGGDSGAKMSRLEILTTAFSLDKEQNKQFKLVFDEAFKNAAPVRLALIKAHNDIGLAIQNNKGQGDIDVAVKDYAAQAAAMTVIEVQAMAKAVQSLHADQRANAAAMTTAFGMLHGMFIDKGKWDTVPDPTKTY